MFMLKSVTKIIQKSATVATAFPNFQGKRLMKIYLRVSEGPVADVADPAELVLVAVVLPGVAPRVQDHLDG